MVTDGSFVIDPPPEGLRGVDWFAHRGDTHALSQVLPASDVPFAPEAAAVVLVTGATLVGGLLAALTPVLAASDAQEHVHNSPVVQRQRRVVTQDVAVL